MMTDEEWVKGISNTELIRKLEWCGHDGYYNDIYYQILKEIKRRLRKGKRNDQRKGMAIKALVVDVPETNIGKWIIVTDSRGQHAECPFCGEWKYHQNQKFCGECGSYNGAESVVTITE